jgi:hypothetical protein
VNLAEALGLGQRGTQKAALNVPSPVQHLNFQLLPVRMFIQVLIHIKSTISKISESL